MIRLESLEGFVQLLRAVCLLRPSILVMRKTRSR